MTLRTDSFLCLPRALFVLSCFYSLLGCEGPVESNRTGSESHFIRCDGDTECTRGTCESGYCELNGRRLVRGEEPDEQPEPEPTSPQSSAGAPAASPATGPDGSSGGNTSGNGTAGAEGSGGNDSNGTDSGGTNQGGTSQGGTGVVGTAGASAAGAGAGGAPSSSAAPLAFRIVNETSEVIHLDGSHSVRCGALGLQANCWYTTTDLCLFDCSEIEAGAQCELNCEQPIPFVLRLQPGQEQVVPWDGRFIVRNESRCSAGDCYDASPVGDGSYLARVTAYAEAVCQFEPCVDLGDGITEGYQTAGSYRHAEVAFGIPSTEEEVLLVVRDDALTCPPAPEACCGDGFVNDSEACDDGNRTDGDGCNAECGEGGGASGGAGAGGNAGMGGASSVVVTCGEATCGAGEYCREACSGAGDPVGPPSCTPLPVGCENDPSCDCICGGFTSFCTPGAEAIQCGCP